MEAITAFRELVKLSSIALATPDDCERFQHLALERPRNWRSKYPKKRKNADSLSPTTVVKWSVALQAAFERANRNGGKKCVRGVLSADRLIRENPWRMFTWIEGRKKKIRQFSGSEILSLLDYFEREWSYVPVGSLLVKMFLWSAARKSQVTSLRWDRARQIGDEYHFEFIGKWAVERWFRIPVGLSQELEAIRTASPYVFSAYNKQLRRHHERRANPTGARRIATEFAPLNLANWFYERLRNWAGTEGVTTVNVHVFRKTSLQYARTGEDINQQVAHDARVGERVMLGSYVKETDEEMRQRSNRTFNRIVAGMGAEVTSRLGWQPQQASTPIQTLKAAVAREDWGLIAKLANELAAQGNSNAGENPLSL